MNTMDTGVVPGELVEHGREQLHHLRRRACPRQRVPADVAAVRITPTAGSVSNARTDAKW